MKFLVLLFLVGCATANTIHQGQEEEERTFEEFKNKVIEIINNIGNDIKEKYTKFEEWVADTFKEGVSEINNIKEIAKEFIDNAENLGIDVVHEAKEFFSKHKKDLGPLWHKVKDVTGKILKAGSKIKLRG